jgi:hypothetical protein
VTGHLHLNLLGVSLHINETVQTEDGIEQRALWFHTPNRDVVLGKAAVGGSCLA